MQRIAFAVAAVLCLILSLGRFIRTRQYTLVQGVCVKMHVRQINCGGIFLDRGKGSFRYRFAGKDFVYQESSYASSPKITEGSICKLYINPSAPEVCLTPAYHTETVLILVLGILSVLMAAIL